MLKTLFLTSNHFYVRARKGDLNAPVISVLTTQRWVSNTCSSLYSRTLIDFTGPSPKYEKLIVPLS